VVRDKIEAARDLEHAKRSPGARPGLPPKRAAAADAAAAGEPQRLPPQPLNEAGLDPLSREALGWPPLPEETADALDAAADEIAARRDHLAEISAELPPASEEAIHNLPVYP